MSTQGLVLRSENGEIVHGGRWAESADAADRAVLRRCRAPVLDIGCGPARHVLALAEEGIPALGIDLTPHVVQFARCRGALVLERCVFDRVPGSGRWRTVLLLDGNVGIGAAPTELLGRVAELMAPDGVALVEVDHTTRPVVATRARLEHRAVEGPWFEWCVVDADRLGSCAARAGLAVHDRWSCDDRAFAELRHHPSRASR